MDTVSDTGDVLLLHDTLCRNSQSKIYNLETTFFILEQKGVRKKSQQVKGQTCFKDVHVYLLPR